MPEVQEEQIQYKCPLCQRAGRAYRFADDGPTLKALIRCVNCLHRWSVLIARPATK